MCGFLCPTQSSFRVQQFPLELFPFFQFQVSSCPFEPDQELQQFPRHQGAEVFQQLSAQLQERSDSERKNPQPAHRSDSQCFPLEFQPFEFQSVHRSDADSQPPERKNSQCQQAQCQQAQHSYPEHVKPFELFALLSLAEHLVLLEIAHDLEGKVVDHPVFNR